MAGRRRRPAADREFERLAATEPLEPRGRPAALGPPPGPGRPAPVWQPGQVILDDYVIERELGRGGMGAVYLARSRSTGKPLAVKRILPELVRLRQHRRGFLRELLHWSELPPHPHLAAFRFFRSHAGEVFVFAEYVEGGSLRDWIRAGRLAGPAARLDVAIQAAWGLQAAHDCGLVHQDVKPGNILLTAEGLAKITDFGLARAGAPPAGRPRDPGDPTAFASGSGSSTTVPCSGGTPAYCSPEQAERAPVSRATDVWSWALCVLEMYAGGVSWLTGAAGAEALEAYLAEPAGFESGVPMPAAVAEVLRRALRPAPEDRWASLGEAAEELRRAYRQAAGRSFPRRPWTPPARPAAAAQVPARATPLGSAWGDPRPWLERAWRESGGELPDDSGPLLERPLTTRALAISDMAGYEEARGIIEALVAGGRRDLELDLASLCQIEAAVHQAVDDFSGAMACADRAVELLEHLVDRDGRRDLRPELAQAWLQQARAWWWAADYHRVADIEARALALLAELIERDGRADLEPERDRLHTRRGFTLSCAGEEEAALACYDRAIEILEDKRRRSRERHPPWIDELASAYHGKGRLLLAGSQEAASLAFLDASARILTVSLRRDWRPVLANELACVFLNQGLALACLDRADEAWPLLRRAVRLRRRLIEKDGWRQIAYALAEAYLCQSRISRGSGDHAGALRQVRRAVRIYRRMVEREDRRDVRAALAEGRLAEAQALADLGRRQAACRAARRALALFEMEAGRLDRGDLRGRADWTRDLLARLEADPAGPPAGGGSTTVPA